MFFLEKFILFLILLFLIITILKIYKKYNQIEYFNDNYEMCPILNVSDEEVQTMYNINNNSLQYLKLKSEDLSIILCKCKDESNQDNSIEWFFEKSENSSYINSLAEEDLCYLKKEFSACETNIVISFEPYNIKHFMCYKNHEVTTKTIEEIDRYNKQFKYDTTSLNQDEIESKTITIGDIIIHKKDIKKVYQMKWYIFDATYIIENLENNSKLLKKYNINYENTNNYIITNNPNDIIARLYPSYNIKVKDRKQSMYLSYNNKKPRLINYNHINFNNYNSFKRIVWTFTDTANINPISDILQRWNKSWSFNDNNITDNNITVNMNTSDGTYYGNIYLTEDNIYSKYTIFSYNNITNTILAINPTNVFDNEDITFFADYTDNDSDIDINTYLVINMFECPLQDDVTDNYRIIASKINNNSGDITNLCGTNSEICGMSNNYCAEST